MIRTTSLNLSIGNASRGAGEFLRDVELANNSEEKRRLIRNSSFTSVMDRGGGDVSHTPGSPHTPNEYEMRLGRQRLSEIMLSPGKYRSPTDLRVQFKDEDNGSPPKLDLTPEKSPDVDADELLRRETAAMRLEEDLEWQNLSRESAEISKQEYEQRLERLREVQNVMADFYQSKVQEIERVAHQSRQRIKDKVSSDHDYLQKIIANLSAISGESAGAREKKTREILELAEREKVREEDLKKQKEASARKELYEAEAAKLKKVFDQTIQSIVQDCPEAQQLKQKIHAIRAELEADPSIAERCATDVGRLIKDFNEAVAEKKRLQQEAEKAEIERKTEQEKKASESNRYIEAVERLRMNADNRKEFIEREKTLRTNIMRFVQLNVNKIQMNTDNKMLAIGLIRMFSGEDVSLGVGSTKISIGTNRIAREYAMELTAEKILKNVEKLPSEPIKEWIPYATVIVTIWSVSEKFGEIFFDELVSRCPFLVPLYFGDQSAEEADLLVSRLVQYNGESQSSFMPRMKFYARLLGVISSMRAGNRFVFPSNKMWTLLTETVKCKLPSREIAQIAAIVIKSLLETSGARLREVYGKQFTKFIHLLCSEYFPRLNALASNTPNVVNFEVYMKEIIATGGNFAPIR